MAAAKVYVGGIDPGLVEKDIEDEFIRFGTLRSVWVARKPPGFAFVEYDDNRDAEDAIAKMDGHNGWRVEFSRKGERGPPRGGPSGYGGGPRGYDDRGGRDRYSGGGGDRYGDRGGDRYGGGGGGGGGMRSEMKCYECGDPGHFARDCRIRLERNGGAGGGGGGGGYRGRARSRSPIRRRSPSEPRRRSRSPSYGRARSRSPLDRSP